MRAAGLRYSGPVKVVHAVLDTEAAEPAERVQLFVDGSPVDPVVENPPDMGETIHLDVGRHYVLGRERRANIRRRHVLRGPL